MYVIDKGLALHQCAERDCELTGVSWVTVIGMASDNIIDGAGIAVTYLTHPFLGIVVTLAVITHEIPQGISTTLIMKAQGYSLRSILMTLILAGIMYPIGASLNVIIPLASYPAAIAFVAGVFIYIGAHALMTEAHRRFNARVIILLLLGSLVILVIKIFE
jgi:zinc transporter ZupT